MMITELLYCDGESPLPLPYDSIALKFAEPRSSDPSRQRRAVVDLVKSFWVAADDDKG